MAEEDMDGDKSNLASFRLSVSSGGSVLSELSLEESHERDLIKNVARRLTFGDPVPEDKENEDPSLSGPPTDKSDVGAEVERAVPEVKGQVDDDLEVEVIIHVEVAISQYNYHRLNEIKSSVTNYLEDELKVVRIGENIKMSNFGRSSDKIIKESVLQILISCESVAGCGGRSKGESVELRSENVEQRLYFHHLFEESGEQYIENGVESGEFQAVANVTLLPHRDIDGLWESLVYDDDDDIKARLLNFAHTSLYFSHCRVDSHLVSCNRLLLLHGPPGTGKTSLCRALAHKLATRLVRANIDDDYNDAVDDAGSANYTHAQLVEVNSHSLFSRWFSESGKMVTRVFDKISDMLEDSSALLFLLIDEVESLAGSRIHQTATGDPSDAIRAVNAILTGLDRLRSHTNLLVLTTSNQSANLDQAFLDRADLRQYVGPPSTGAIYKMYRESLVELMHRGIVESVPHGIPTISDGIPTISDGIPTMPCGTNTYPSLLGLAKESDGLSGRVVRKIAFLAHALYLPTHRHPIKLGRYFDAMSRAISHKQCESDEVETS